MGDRITISDIQNSNLNIKSTLTNVQQTIGGLPGDDETARQELQALIVQLDQALEKIPQHLKEEAEAAAASARALIESAEAQKPNKTFIEITAEGLKQAAGDLSEVAPTVLGIAGQIVASVMRMRGMA